MYVRALAMVITWLVFSAASIIYNVLPHLRDALASGWTDSAAAGAMALQIGCILALTAVPAGFLIKKDWAWRAFLIGMAALFALQAWKASLDQASHRQDVMTRGAREKIEAAEILDRDIVILGKDLEAAKIRKAKFGSVVSDKAIQTLEREAKLAEDQACNWSSEKCASSQVRARDARAKVSQAAIDQATLQGAVADIEKLVHQLEAKRDEREKIGPVPTHIDASAAEFTKIAHAAGWRSMTEQRMSEILADLAALIAELLPVFGSAVACLVVLKVFEGNSAAAAPIVLAPISARTAVESSAVIPAANRLTADPVPPPAALAASATPTPESQAQRNAEFDAPVEQPEQSTNAVSLTANQPTKRTRKPAGLASKPKKSGKPQKSRVAAPSLADLRDVGDIDAWFEDAKSRNSIIEKTGAEAPAGQCQAAYFAWCDAHNYKRLSPKEFGAAMKAKLGNDKIEKRRNYVYYQGFMLRPAIVALAAE